MTFSWASQRLATQAYDTESTARLRDGVTRCAGYGQPAGSASPLTASMRRLVTHGLREPIGGPEVSYSGPSRDLGLRLVRRESRAHSSRSSFTTKSLPSASNQAHVRTRKSTIALIEYMRWPCIFLVDEARVRAPP